ncbi:MAG TPA: GNAT family N-acetyltransferase [Gammaproteobacteria bacterium]|nr:GNAT family N-acetyltransferase [Gammaproteobacteria bacterium]
MGHIRKDIDWWRNNQEQCISLVAGKNERLVGVIQIVECGNMKHLFVHPEFQRRRMASSLVDAALTKCRNKAGGGTVKLNSSNFAIPFYKKYDFVQTGEARPLPGGCVPFEFRF